MKIKEGGEFIDTSAQMKVDGVFRQGTLTPVGGVPINSTIDSVPTDPTDQTPTWAFHTTGGEALVYQLVSIDQGTPAYTVLPGGTDTYTAPSALASGDYFFRCLSVDSLGNVEAEAAVDAFTITAPLPPINTVIDTGPTGATTDNTPTWTYHATDADTTPGYQTSIDQGTPAFGAPTASETYTPSALADGSWTFRVRAIDTRGIDPSPALRSITVNTSTPGTVNSLAQIASALASATPGQIIYVADGTYGNLQISANKAGPPHVELRALNPGQVTFSGGTHSLNNSRYIKLSQVNVVGELTLRSGNRNCWINHCKISGGYMGIQVNPNISDQVYDAQITGCKFQGNFGEDALRLNYWQNLLIEENEITGVIEIGTHNDSLQTVWGGGTHDLIYRRNYQHDNRSQNFFIKDQASAVIGIRCEDSLFLRNSVPSPGHGQPSVFQVFGPYTGLVMDRNTIWGNGNDSIAVFQDMAGATGNQITNNVVYRYYSSSPVVGTMSNNTIGTGLQGTFPTPTGQILTQTPGFNNTAVDDYRILAGPSAGRGVSWKPSDFVYGPEV